MHLYVSVSLLPPLIAPHVPLSQPSQPRQTVPQLEPGSAPKFLPSKSQFFLTAVAKFPLVRECLVFNSYFLEIIKEYGLLR